MTETKIEEPKADESKKEEEKNEEEEDEIEDGRILFAVMYTQDSMRERPKLFAE